MKKLTLWTGVIVGLLTAAPAAAWDGVTRGKIPPIDVVSDGGNFGFRVYMSAGPMCETWACINSNTSNHKENGILPYDYVPFGEGGYDPDKKERYLL